MEVLIENKSAVKINENNFQQIYDEHFEKIYRFIYYKTYNRETSEDITSMTFLKALENLYRYDPSKASITTWLYRIARNLVIDHYRTIKRTINIHDVWDLSSDEIGDEKWVIDIHNKDRMEKIKGVMEKMTSKHRDIIIMRIWQKMPYKKIAEIMGKSEASCKMMYARTINRLKESLSLAVLIVLLNNSKML